MLCLFLGEEYTLINSRGKKIDVASCLSHEQAPLDLGASTRRTRGFGAISRERELLCD